MTDYLIGHENTTVVYNCIQPVSVALLVTLLDFDGNTVIQPFNMRSGIDQKLQSSYTRLSILVYSNPTPLIFPFDQNKAMFMQFTDYLLVICT